MHSSGSRFLTVSPEGLKDRFILQHKEDHAVCIFLCLGDFSVPLNIDLLNSFH